MDGLLGEIRIFAGNFAPKNWAFCEGQTMGIGQYSGLFAVIANTYGGNGQTTFLLPDLRGRIPYSTNIDSTSLPQGRQGDMGGTETHRMTELEMPLHTHTLRVTKDKLKPPVAQGAASTPNPNGALLTITNANFYSTNNNGIPYGTPETDLSITLDHTGQAGPFTIMQPSLAVHYIICIKGEFPPRD